MGERSTDKSEESRALLPAAMAAQQQQLDSLLSEIEQACVNMTTSLKVPAGELDVAAAQSSIAAAASSITALHARLAGEGSQLQAVTAGGWVAAALQLADAGFFGQQHHRALGQEQTLLRNLLRDSVLPTLVEAAKQQTCAAGFQLHAEFKAVLALAHTAAEVIGWRDERTAAAPSMRHYGTVNVLWLPGVLNLWSAVPPALRPELEDQGLGAAAVMRRVVGYLAADLTALCEAKHGESDERLLKFWIQFVNKLVAAFPEAASATWSAVLKWQLDARHHVLTLSAGTGAALPAKAQEAAASVAKVGTLWTRGARTLVTCLNVLPEGEEGPAAALEALAFLIAAEGQPGAGRGASALSALYTALDIMKEAATMTPAVRAACQPLVRLAFGALLGPAAAAGFSGPLRGEVARAALVFMAACCDGATGRDGLDATLQHETWARCEAELCRLAVQPHPAVAATLSELWAAVIRLSGPETAGQHIEAVHALLAVAAAGHAGAGPYKTLPPVAQQLGSLLASLLSSAPPMLSEGCFTRFLQASARDFDDICRLACLSAELQAGQLVDAVTGSAACVAAAQAAVQQLSLRLGKAMDYISRAGPTADQAANLGWLLDSIASGIGFLSRAGAESGSALPGALLHNIVRVLVGATSSGEVPEFAAPALAALCSARSLPGALQPDLLVGLLPALEALLRGERTAALAVSLAPAYKAVSGVPLADMWGFILTANDPVLGHLGVDAYVEYIRGCKQSDVLAVLPAELLEGGAMCGALKARVEAHLRRCPSPSYEGPRDEDLHSWACVLCGDAADALHQLHAARAACPAACGRDAEEGHAPIPGRAPAPGVASETTRAAFEGVLAAMARLEDALASHPGSLPDGAAAALRSRLQLLH